jgi:hypothetical protein
MVSGGTGLSACRKTEEDKPHEVQIGSPENVKHEGSVSFNKQSGAFVTQNLPPAYQTFFDNLNKTLSSMGVTGLTEKEAKLLLKLPIDPVATKPRSPSVAGRSPSVSSGKEPAISAPQLVHKGTVEEQLGAVISDLQARLAGLEAKLTHTKKQLDRATRKTAKLQTHNQALKLEVVQLRSQVTHIQ